MVPVPCLSRHQFTLFDNMRFTQLALFPLCTSKCNSIVPVVPPILLSEEERYAVPHDAHSQLDFDYAVTTWNTKL